MAQLRALTHRRSPPTIVIHKDGSANLQMEVTFSGLACGQPAELKFNDHRVRATDVSHEVPVERDSGGSDSRRLRGHGEFEALAGIGGVYQGQAHCG